MKRLRATLLSLLFLLTFASSGIAEKGRPDEDARERRARVYEHIIGPWVEKWFKEHSLEVNLADRIRIKRKLLVKDFYNFDNVDGMDLYTIKVLYLVDIDDRSSNLKVWGLKEQKIVFWLEGLEVKDFYPSEDYWKERPHYTKTTDAVAI